MPTLDPARAHAWLVTVDAAHPRARHITAWRPLGYLATGPLPAVEDPANRERHGRAANGAATTIAPPQCSGDLWLGGPCRVHGSRDTRDELVSLRGSVSALAGERDRLRAALQRIAAAPEEDGRRLAAIAADAISAQRP